MWRGREGAFTRGIQEKPLDMRSEEQAISPMKRKLGNCDFKRF
jgi:hypothetical protein